MPRKYFRYTRIDGISRLLIERQIRSWFKDYQLRGKRSIERFMQLVFAIWTRILLVEIEHPTRPKKKTLGEMADHVKHDSFIDLVIYVWESCNLPVPDEGGPLYKLKAIGLKVGK